jgi:hypothetical protein
MELRKPWCIVVRAPWKRWVHLVSSRSILYAFGALFGVSVAAGCRLIAGISSVQLADAGNELELEDGGPTADGGLAFDAGMQTEAGDRIANFDEKSCAAFETVAPRGVGEGGNWAAARLTPSKYPFVVERIGYELDEPASDPNCDNAITHQVIVFKVRTSTPPEVPVPYFAFTTESLTAPPRGIRLVEHIFEKSDWITLDAGDKLFIAVQFPLNGNRYGCTPYCQDNANQSVADQNFWWVKVDGGPSIDNRPDIMPGQYLWKTLKSIDPQYGTLRFAAYGNYP